MDITPLIAAGRRIIQSYSNNRFRISGELFEGPVLVLPDRVLAWETPDAPENIQPGDFRQIEEGGMLPGIILIGCGARGVFLPPSLKMAMKQRGASVEAMDTGAACRTYNVLMAEERSVAAALFPAARL